MMDVLLREDAGTRSEDLVEEALDDGASHDDGLGFVRALVISLPVSVAAWGVAIWAALQLLR